MRGPIRIVCALALISFAAPATAQTPAIEAAREAGKVGERFDGYLGFVTSVSDQELLAKVKPGELYMLNDGVWRRRAPGQPAPVPSYCAP